MNKIYYKEEQSYTQFWVWMLILLFFTALTLPLWYIFIEDIIQRKSSGATPGYDSDLLFSSVITTTLILPIILLFKFIKLETEITTSAVRFRYLPFIRKWRTIKASDIESWSVEKYAISKHGGWGIKSRSRKNKAYSVYGRVCLNLKLKDGQTVTVGTQQKDSIDYAMRKMMQRNQQR